MTVTAADRVVQAVRAPTVVFLSPFDSGIRNWFRTEVDDLGWDGGSVLMLASIFEPDNPFGRSKWRRERGALLGIGPHALALLLPTLGPVEQVGCDSSTPRRKFTFRSGIHGGRPDV